MGKNKENDQLNPIVLGTSRTNSIALNPSLKTLTPHLSPHLYPHRSANMERGEQIEYESAGKDERNLDNNSCDKGERDDTL